MQKLKLFGCHDFYIGGRIIAFISLVQNFVKVAVSLGFLVWASQQPKTYKVERGEVILHIARKYLKYRIQSPEMSHAGIYAAIGCAGVFFSVLLILGISRKCFKCFVPWICFQLLNICYQVYFIFEALKSDRYDFSSYSSMLILMIFIFNSIFECYYLCLIIGLSQIIANINAIGSTDVEMSPFRDINCKESSIILMRAKQVLEGTPTTTSIKSEVS